MRRLARKDALAYDDLFADAQSKSELVATFMALLELIKGKRVRVDGTGNAVTVRLLRGQKEDSNGN